MPDHAAGHPPMRRAARPVGRLLPGRPGAAAGLLLGSLLGPRWLAGAAGRPCRDGDWAFALGECAGDPGTPRSRAAFAYAPPGRCDPEALGSRPAPAPVLGLPCRAPCEQGTYLAVGLTATPGEGASSKPAQLQVGCQPCAPGRFSLGGGHFYDGDTADWAKPWPSELATFCFYRGVDYQWHPGSGTPLLCVIHLGGDLTTETRPGTWNEQLAEAELEIPLVAAPGDSLACTALGSGAFRGAAVLVSRGTCTFSKKTENVAAAGGLAVVVYNSEPNAGYFYPAPADPANPPQIPIFMITREDGLLWLAKLNQAAGPTPLTMHATTTRCSAGGLEALPVTHQGAQAGNNSAEFLAQESWDSISNRLGCAPWSTDPTGHFLHSGNNLHFHWIYSVLVLSIQFVRDGHLRFRFSVDAEDQYDGLSFLMNQVELLPKVSRQWPAADLLVEVPRGSHTFAWIYSKDFSGTVGEDRARLQLLEIVGSQYADLECRDCGRAHGVQGCAACARDEYLSNTSSTGDGAVCLPCPVGYWSPAGSVALASCLRRRPCEERDFMLTYSAFEMESNGSRTVVVGETCRRGETLVRSQWRQPSVCDPARPDSVKLPAEAVKPCPPCQPNDQRVSGGDCRPAEGPRCPSDQYAFHELAVSFWHTWPRNFTTEEWAPAASGSTGQGWQLEADGGAAVVGTAFEGGGGHREVAAALAGKGLTEAALLHLDLLLMGAGNLSFFFTSRPAGVWGSMATLKVNGAAPEAQYLSGPLGSGGDALWQVVVPLPGGPQRVTWTWTYSANVQSSSDDNPEEHGLTGMRLVNVSAAQAAGAGASTCRQCPAGYEVAFGAASCTMCPAGRSAEAGAGVGGCSMCPSGRTAEAGSAVCRACGPGLRSDAGAARCEPMAEVGLASFVGGTDRRRWSVDAVVQAWNASGVLRPLKVEDRLYYFGLFNTLPGPAAAAPSPAGGGSSLAYWWERLPPRGSPEAGGRAACPAGGFGVTYREVGGTLESLEPVADGEVVGLWASFSGSCEGVPRTAKVLFRCDFWAATASNVLLAAVDALEDGGVTVPTAGPSGKVLLADFVGGARPSTPAGCEDIAIEWRTPSACPLCHESDFVPVAVGACDPRRGRMVGYVPRSPCFGGAEAPQAFYEPCGGSGLAIIMVVATVVPVSCVLCCLISYVLLLRRRYAKYMVLGEGEERALRHPSVTPTNIGASASAP